MGGMAEGEARGPLRAERESHTDMLTARNLISPSKWSCWAAAVISVFRWRNRGTDWEIMCARSHGIKQEEPWLMSDPLGSPLTSLTSWPQGVTVAPGPQGCSEQLARPLVCWLNRALGTRQALAKEMLVIIIIESFMFLTSVTPTP